MMDRNINVCPPIGVALWLLEGKSMTDCVEWVINNDFEGVSLLQNVMELDKFEKIDVAAAIKSAGLKVTYHGNVNDHLKDFDKLDVEFICRMIDDVIWWHENTDGVFSCCSDAINISGDNCKTVFDFEINFQFMKMLSSGLKKFGIRTGIENSFGGDSKFCSLDDISKFENLEIGMILDVGHANIHVRSDGKEGESEVGEYVRKFPLDILEVHFSDNFGKKDEHKQIGYGNLDLESLFSALKKKSFSGIFTIEVCLDILSGKYFLDICNSKHTDSILISRDRIKEVWG